jgi:uncharacterized protein
MSLIIDGYNLLYAVGVLGGKSGPHRLERARLALLNFLTESLAPEDIPRTAVVFDAHAAPWGAPRTLQHRGLTVHFAARYEDADSLIEELIRRESAPRRLRVVSSDHRLQKAARRRRATAIDSETWYDEVVRRRLKRQRAETEADVAVRPPTPLLEEDVDYWMRQFGGEALLKELFPSAAAAVGDDRDDDPAQPARAGTEPAGDAADDDVPEIDAEIENPFPPGYAEELQQDDIEAAPRPKPKT